MRVLCIVKVKRALGAATIQVSSLMESPVAGADAPFLAHDGGLSLSGTRAWWSCHGSRRDRVFRLIAL